MKHVTLLALVKDRDQALEELRELGSVEVMPVQAPSGGTLEEARERLARAERALEGISTLGQEAESLSTQAPGSDANADQVIERVTGLLKTRADLAENRQTLQDELERLASLGDFDTEAIAKLAEKGVTVRVIEAAAGQRLVAPSGLGLQPIAATGDAAVYALYGRGDIDPAIDLGGTYVPFRLPDHSPAQMRRLVHEADESLAGVNARLLGLSAHRSLLSQRAAEIAEDVRYLEVREGMGAAEGVCYLEGYAPEESIDALRESAGRFGWGLLVRSPRSGEQVPTLIRYPKIIQPIKTLFSFLRILPGYWETDVSWTVLVFFTLFVGLLIGDACYGLLMVALAIVLFVRVKRARSAAVLLLMLGLSVVFFGAVSGSWLGIKNLPPFLASLKIDWLADNQNVMNLSFLIGAVHLSIAHVWNSITEFPRATFLAQIGWLLIVWAMYFLASSIVLGNPLPTFEFYLLGAGIVLVIVFMTPASELKGNMMNHFLLPLTLVSFFTDIISYVRLFAVGVATVAVMDAFNGMAMSIGFGNVLTAAAAILILVFGHSLNLVLAALAVLVHAVRLNTLEFSTHKGLSWSGRVFRPFARSAFTAESTAQLKG
ncbi:MAG: hypothetical protein GXX83_05090 [Gaiellales bacterium]|nr:hypothetical protein [Gaiellales bacterium]